MRHVSLSWSEALGQWWRSTLCKLLGHAKPEQKMFCRICSRCRNVLPPERRRP